MFTGLIECVGLVAAVEKRGGVVGLTFDSSLPVQELQDGESVAVDGVCLTVAARAHERWSAEAIPETLARTTIGSFAPGRRVNLERSLKVGDRLGGHLVAGHVDATGQVLDVRAAGGERRLIVEIDLPLRRYVSEKGSVAVDGVSLTIARLHASGFEVALVPQTLARTTLGERVAGDRVNVEVDLVARYLESLLRGG